jgi:hypothetical protein
MGVGTEVSVGWASSYALEPGVSLTGGYGWGGEGQQAGAGPAGGLTGTENDDGCCFSPACTSFPFPEGWGVQTRCLVSHFPTTPRATPICDSVSQIVMWCCPNEGPTWSLMEKTATRMPKIPATCLRLWPCHLITWPVQVSGITQVMVNQLADNVPLGRSWASGNVRGTALDDTVAMHWGRPNGPLSKCLKPHCLRVVGGPVMPERGLPLKFCDLRQKDTATQSSNQGGEGLEIVRRGGRHR